MSNEKPPKRSTPPPAAAMLASKRHGGNGPTEISDQFMPSQAQVASGSGTPIGLLFPPKRMSRLMVEL